jgi:HlyD family secretion protein
MKLRLLALGLAVVLVAGLTFGVFRTGAPEARYLTAPVERGNLTTTLAATGTLSAVTTVQVGSQLSGQIAELLVDFNDKVTKGQPIARLDSDVYAAAVREAEAALDVAEASVATSRAALEKARADLSSARVGRVVAAARTESARAEAEDARRDFERKRALAGGATLAQAAADHAAAVYQSAAARLRAAEAEQAIQDWTVFAAAAGLKMAEAELQHAEAAVRQQAAVLEQAQVDLARTVIRAPIDGEIIGRDVDRGQTVAASLEAPTLFTIARDLRQMEVHAAIDEADIGQVRLGQQAAFTVDAYPERVFAGTVTEIRKAPQVVENVVTYTVVLDAQNADLALLPGMTAVLQIEVERVEDVLKVPNAALRFRPAEPAAGIAAQAADAPAHAGTATVWVPGGDGSLAPLQVTLGRSDTIATELVTGPLRAGQSVIVGTAAPADDSSLFGLRWGL